MELSRCERNNYGWFTDNQCLSALNEVLFRYLTEITLAMPHTA